MKRQLACLILGFLWLISPVRAGQFIVDQQGTGFSDATAVAPVGGNGGTTLGEQRLIAVTRALQYWADILHLSVDMHVTVSFDALECSAGSAVLAQAGPTSLDMNFPGAPLVDTYYPAPLANQLQNTPSGAAVMQIQVNGSIGAMGCLTGYSWYYGLDGKAGDQQQDLQDILHHEIAHGLGFLTVADISSGQLWAGKPDIFLLHLYDTDKGRSWTAMTDAERKSSATSNGKLVWDGPAVKRMAGSLSDGLVAGMPRMYAPKSLSPGSSVSHFDTALRYAAPFGSADEVMEPFASPNVGIALTVALLRDLGWTDAHWDIDRDGAFDDTDNCRFESNADQSDIDSDGKGDPCDSDIDGDGLSNAQETKLGTDPYKPDTDGDGVPDKLDKFPLDPNESVDTDHDGLGDGVDPDDDNDGIPDVSDNCRIVVNLAQADADQDGIGDACDDDPLGAMRLLQQSGDVARQSVGKAVAAIGDVDGDGVPDLAVGLPADNHATGKLLILSGKDGSVLRTLYGSTRGEAFGAAMAGVGDVDGDSHADFIVGSPLADVPNGKRNLQHAGKVVLYSGATGVAIDGSERSGSVSGMQFGSALASADDLDSDGQAEWIVGSPGYAHSSGRVQVLSGKTGAVRDTLDGQKPGDAFGAAVSGGLDPDGDGTMDIAVGAPGASATVSINGRDRVLHRAGRVSLYNVDSHTALQQWQGTAAGEAFGSAVSLTADLSGDGVADLWIGTPLASVTADVGGKSRVLRQAGRLELFSLKSASPQAPVFSLHGLAAGDRMGGAVAASADIDGDGTPDVLAGMTGFDVPTTVTTRKGIEKTVLLRNAGNAVLLSGQIAKP